jgi:hypothetical protein
MTSNLSSKGKIKAKVKTAIYDSPFGAAAMIAAILNGIVFTISGFFKLTGAYNWFAELLQASSPITSGMPVISFFIASMGMILAIIGLFVDRNKAIPAYAICLMGLPLVILGLMGFTLLLVRLATVSPASARLLYPVPPSRVRRSHRASDLIQ